MGKGRAPCCDKYQVVKGSWSPAEDLKLISFINKHGHLNWRTLPKQAGLQRCGKSCRLRWKNYLSPNVKRGNFTAEDEDTIISLRERYGNKWSKIASHLSGRTDNEIKNFWNTRLKKKLGMAPAPIKRAERRAKESNESSPVITSSSSSSSTLVSSSGDVRSGQEEGGSWDEGSSAIKKFRPQVIHVVKTEHQEGPKELSKNSSSSSTSSSHRDVLCLEEDDIQFLLELGLGANGEI